MFRRRREHAQLSDTVSLVMGAAPLLVCPTMM